MIHPMAAIRAAALASLASMAGCSEPVGPIPFDEPIELSAEWQTASPAAAGMDAEALARAEAAAAAIPRLESLLVVRRGRLVLERYARGRTAGELADVRSVTKSVVSTLVGLALERGVLPGLDARLGDLLPSQVAPLDPWEREITVRDLLTMSGGWEWDETYVSGYNAWVLSADPVAYLLAKPRAAEPGASFAYNSAAVHLLGIVLEEASGSTLPELADQWLFRPLGITARAWEPLGGRTNGGAGLDLRPRDLARIGQLFLQDGWSGSRRILPGGWVGQATTRRYPWVAQTGPAHFSYGWLWWTDEDHRAYCAWGYGGQFIYVAPERDLVVVATTEWRQVDGQGAPYSLASQVLEVIVEGVLPAAPVD